MNFPANNPSVVGTSTAAGGLLGNLLGTEESQLDDCGGDTGNGYFDVIGYLRNGTSNVTGSNIGQWGAIKTLGRSDVPNHRLDSSLLWTFSLGKESRA